MLQTITRRTALFAVMAMFAGGVLVSNSAPAFAHGKKIHKLAVHVNSADPKTQNLALNNVANVYKYYKSKGEKIEIAVIAYGPGLHMLRTDTSKVKDRIEKISLELDDVSFAACGNTKTKMTKKEGKSIPIMAEAKPVTSGVVRLMELQEGGWSYLRP